MTAREFAAVAPGDLLVATADSAPGAQQPPRSYRVVRRTSYGLQCRAAGSRKTVKAINPSLWRLAAVSA